MAPRSSRRSNVIRVLLIAGAVLWCVGLGLAIGYSQSKPPVPDAASGRTYALWRPGRSGGAVYLTATEFISLGVIWAVGAILLAAGVRSGRRLVRTPRQPPPQT